jgi:hypothetical protein
MYPPEAIHALKEALKSVYWYKDDLRLFLRSLDLPKGLLERQGWHDPKEYKVRIVSAIIDQLVSMGEHGLGPMRRLIKAVATISQFDHLSRLDDGARKAQTARDSVARLRAIVATHDKGLLGQDHRQSRTPRPGAVRDPDARNEEVQRLQRQFFELATVDDHRRRGLLFEPFLKDLFAAHDLDPRGSFRATGEQIDGAFEFDGTQFLLEAKWEKSPQGVEALDAFARKVERRLENTLGLFVSLESFSAEGLEAFRHTRSSIILMDGEDLAIVLQGLIDFRDLLKRKIRHASHKGDPYLRAREVIG